MSSLKTIFCAVVAATSLAVSAREFPDDNYRIQVSLSGSTQPLRGGQELAALFNLKRDDRVFDLPSPVLLKGRSYQLSVTVTDPAGATQSYTGSPRLRYETFGCLTVSTLGMLTVTALTGVLCIDPDWPQLWVVLTDSGGNPIAMNQYLFTVR